MPSAFYSPQDSGRVDEDAMAEAALDEHESVDGTLFVLVGNKSLNFLMEVRKFVD